MRKMFALSMAAAFAVAALFAGCAPKEDPNLGAPINMPKATKKAPAAPDAAKTDAPKAGEAPKAGDMKDAPKAGEAPKADAPKAGEAPKAADAPKAGEAPKAADAKAPVAPPADKK